MEFGIYVQFQGYDGLLKECAKKIDASLNEIFNKSGFEEIDAIYVSFQSTNSIQAGFKVCKLHVRRNYDLKLITGGKVHYNCMIECDLDIPDCDVIEADSKDKMISYLKGLLIELAPKLFGEFPPRETEYFLSAVRQAKV